ncbi:MAG: DUF72 domain-containing protein, partial [Pseudomonadota bacterium]|nr:DUF72 domain-containing protein [Pseudomonadota bacterium]
MRVRIGTAGWSIPRRVAEAFPAEGTGLERYAARFDAAEINSTFYRPHKPATLERWAASTPEHFRFAVKLPKAITHERRLADALAPTEEFLESLAPLGARLGPVLVQLPPKLAFDPPVAEAFFRGFRALFDGALACEPRHGGWFGPEAAALLAEHRVARVAADPARVPEAAEPGGWPGLVYHRLHGSPRIYYSEYEPEFIDTLAQVIAPSAVETWCVFDNTVSGAAAANALALQ